jgi:hypothetical protein
VRTGFLGAPKRMKPTNATTKAARMYNENDMDCNGEGESGSVRLINGQSAASGRGKKFGDFFDFCKFLTQSQLILSALP